MAAPFFGRVMRRLRAASARIAAFIFFSGLLTYIFILYQPTKGPGDRQQLGWQSWEIVSLNHTAERPIQLEDTGSPNSSTTNSTGWWDVEAIKETSVDTSSLPLNLWNPLLPHDTGFTEIAVRRCLFPPWYVDICWPGSTAAETAKKGKWVRVERNIHSKSGPWYLNMYYRRTRKLDVPLVTELRLLSKGDEKLLPDRNSWYSAGTSLRDGIVGQPKLYLWWKLGPARQQLSQNDTQNLITELDVVYGAGSPMYGFETLDPEVTAGRVGKDPVRIAYRRGPPSIPRAPPLHFNREGTYKILQVADLHFSVSYGACRDTDLTPCEHSDNLTSNLLATTLDAEKPDLVVFTGDQLNGQGTSWDSRSVLAKFAIPVIKRRIPWTAVFGNHDAETDMSRDFEMKHLTQLPYFVGEAGPSTIHGVGNFVLKVFSADASKTQLLTLYLLDSGSYDTGFFDFFGFTPTSYNYLRDTQIEWFLSESAKISPIQRPFVPDGARDLGNIWKRQAVLPPESRLAKPNAMMFFHIPLQEAYTSPDIDPSSGKPLDVGQQLEGSGAAKKNAGFFEKALLNATEESGSHRKEVKVVANGHCHVSENCRRVKGIWMCFGGGGSYSGYGKVGFDRRFRVYNISDYGETIQTYKRTEHEEIMDKLILTGEGAAPPYEGLRRI